MAQELHRLGAKAVVKLLRSGRVTPLQLIDVFEARLAATEHLVHATPITCLERARRAAENLAHPAEPPPGYLWGLPVLIKDGQPVAGVRFTEGSGFFKDRVARRSEALVLRIEAMGGIVVGKTNLPEFGIGSHTFNEVFPMTVSPYDVRTSAGGSSGGAAAALAACQGWLATGSDLGGSLRTPAAFCGVVGFRNTPGRTPRPKAMPGKHAGGLPHDLQAVNGLMARSVGDLALFLDAVAPEAVSGARAPGWDTWPSLPPLGAESWQAAAARGAARSHGGWRVVYSTLGCPVAAEVEHLCRTAAERLAVGGSFEAREEPFSLDVAERVFYVLRAASLYKDFASASAELRASLKPELRWNIDSYGAFPGEATSWEASALSESLLLAEQAKSLFAGVDVLATPATMDAAFDARVRYPVEDFGAEHEPFSNYLSWMKPAYLISSLPCPALVLPVGLLPDGRPVGLQLVGASGADGAVLEAAAALEAALGLEMQRGLPSPRRGEGPLRGRGPKTAEEAAQHHEGALEAFKERYGKPPRAAL
mmetsp:Transcript_60188/g.179225  ORF Transcript_60188/g.179225 Transcript_60188/m.179225 type:complete len:536 (+) Transcript_60188:66-1673(+)